MHLGKVTAEHMIRIIHSFTQDRRPQNHKRNTHTHRSMTGRLSVEDTLSGQTGVTVERLRDTRDGASNQI